MTLRIHKANSVRLRGQPQNEDGWSSRLAKLIPAESLGLYGAGATLVTTQEIKYGLPILFCTGLFLTFVIRYKNTLETDAIMDNKKPQWPLIIIALISFTLWSFALPVDLRPSNNYVPEPENFAFFAFLWATIIPVVYKGD